MSGDPLTSERDEVLVPVRTVPIAGAILVAATLILVALLGTAWLIGAVAGG